ncbi:hypothetical protein B0T26DRAFT_261005 [Lasiosphaeria miniovina]|uniref:Uncharacterized protein n=1 Tax=Lasiosphaeria miniovina TaxID=1954250 RepID=A0AA40AWX8_9PEZI|nr:uncharacterized protein B0T26DRAFT_261005 [Lasiosphaeria miniovina]KAK0723451.1 hypothetical protein B0T26DRAFT_261005 [Lasiosphaeria miniovina]
MADNTIQPSHQTPTVAESSQSLVSDSNPASTDDAGLAIEPTQDSPDSENFSAVPGISPQHDGPVTASPGIRSEEDDFAAVPEINIPQGESPPPSDTPEGNEDAASQHMIPSGDYYFGHHDNTTDRDESENNNGSVNNDQSGGNNSWDEEDGGPENTPNIRNMNVSDKLCQLCGSDQHPSDSCFLNDSEVDLDVANLLRGLPTEDLIEIIRTDVLMSYRGPIAALIERVENLTSARSCKLYALLLGYSDAQDDSDRDRLADGSEVFVPSPESSVLPVVEVPDHADEPESKEELGHDKL